MKPALNVPADDDLPGSLAVKEVRKRREALIDTDPAAKLNAEVRKLRARLPKSIIPWFDPLDGGIKARVLFLLESPGPKAKGSGFISRNNPDATAKTCWMERNRARLHHRDLLAWNIVPWFLPRRGTGGTFRSPRKAEIAEGARELARILKLCNCLTHVVLQGRKAEDGWPLVLRAYEPASLLTIIPSPHPGGRGLAHKGAKRRLRQAYIRVREALKG